MSKLQPGRDGSSDELVDARIITDAAVPTYLTAGQESVILFWVVIKWVCANWETMTERIRIRVNRRVCGGCLSCVTTCSMVNESYVSLSAARVQVELRPFERSNQIIICRQCTNAACVEACSEGAIARDSDGYLVVNYDLCNGCRACINACPFDAMFWNPISDQVIKCELCGGDPECVHACPTGALTVRVTRSKKSKTTSK